MEDDSTATLFETSVSLIVSGQQSRDISLTLKVDNLSAELSIAKIKVHDTN